MVFTEFESQVGTLRLVADDVALREIFFVANGTPACPLPRDDRHPLLRRARRQLEEYFASQRREFDLPLAPQGTAFQLAVWRALQEIPYGTTASYAEQAARIGKPEAVRAVGLANGRNPLPIVIPCHRVIGSDGSLTGYGGGLPIKKALLELEGVLVKQKGLF